MRIRSKRQQSVPELQLPSPSTVETRRNNLSASFSPSSSPLARRRVRFDSAVSVRPIPARKDLNEPENLWWHSSEISREQAAIEKIVHDFNKLVDGCPRWMMKKEQRNVCDDLQGVVKYSKLLLASKQPTDKMVTQLASCLNRAPDLRGLERRLVPKYDAAVREHSRLICQIQHEKNLAKKATEMSYGNVLFGQAVAQHDAAQARAWGRL